MADDQEPFEGEVLRIEASQDRSGVTIILAREFNMTGTERFWAFVSDALAANPKALTIDAGGLEFIDSSGLQALLHARDAATEAGVAFRVSDASPALRRLFELAVRAVQGRSPQGTDQVLADAPRQPATRSATR